MSRTALGLAHTLCLLTKGCVQGALFDGMFSWLGAPDEGAADAACESLLAVFDGALWLSLLD